LLDRLTVTPPRGAAAVRVTVPVELPPPRMVEGETVTLPRTATLGAGAVTVRVVVTELDEAAVIVTLWVALTALVVTANVAEN